MPGSVTELTGSFGSWQVGRSVRGIGAGGSEGMAVVVEAGGLVGAGGLLGPGLHWGASWGWRVGPVEWLVGWVSGVGGSFGGSFLCLG